MGEPLGGSEPIDGLLGRPLHCVAQQKVQAPDTNTDSQNRNRLLWSLISSLLSLVSGLWSLISSRFGLVKGT